MLKGVAVTGAIWSVLSSFLILQTYNLLPVLTGLENVELPLQVYRISPKQARARAWDSIARVGLVESRTSVVYPLTFPFQTGVTIASLGLVTFLIVLIVTLNLAAVGES
jgi:predicted ABC-type transport system involved in lysophospholipase L1 biosynthesis ATPase subunit